MRRGLRGGIAPDRGPCPASGIFRGDIRGLERGTDLLRSHHHPASTETALGDRRPRRRLHRGTGPPSRRIALQRRGADRPEPRLIARPSPGGSPRVREPQRRPARFDRRGAQEGDGRQPDAVRTHLQRPVHAAHPPGAAGRRRPAQDDEQGGPGDQPPPPRDPRVAPPPGRRHLHRHRVRRDVRLHVHAAQEPRARHVLVPLPRPRLLGRAGRGTPRTRTEPSSTSTARPTIRTGSTSPRT